MKMSCFIALVVALLFGCRKEPEVSLPVARIDVSFEGLGVDSVRVYGFGGWRAESLADWCRVEMHSDTTLYIWVEPNTGSFVRQAVVRFSAGSSRAELLVVQRTASEGDYARYSDSLALMSIFRQGGGKEWTWDVGFQRDLTDLWSPKRTISNWEGVATERIDGSLRVRGLDLRAINNFSGKLSDSLALMSKLSQLYLGSLPLPTSPLETLSKLESIEVLDISFAPYTIVWPTKMGGLKSLILLNASGTKHPSDRLDEGWNELTKLQTVELAGCGLVGGFPQTLLNSQGLSWLDLSNNPKMGGGLPSQVGQLARLEHLDVSLCGLTGTLPDALGQLSFLEGLKAANNPDLGGAIPASLGAIRNLQTLNLSGCAFTELPLEVWNCRYLSYVDVSFNRLTGSIPVAVASMPYLEFLGLAGNRMSGKIPDQVLAAPHWGEWASASWICPQQTGYGFSNCQ